MPFTIGKCKLFRIKHTRGRNIFKKRTQNCIFLNKVHFFLVEKKTAYNDMHYDGTISSLSLIGSRRVKAKRFFHTYIIGHYKSSVRIIDLVSHITYVVSERQSFEKLFMTNNSNLGGLESWLFV